MGFDAVSGVCDQNPVTKWSVTGQKPVRNRSETGHSALIALQIRRRSAESVFVTTFWSQTGRIPVTTGPILPGM